MNKTYVAIDERYHRFPRIVSDQFIRFCGICGLSLIQHSQNRLTCIETKLFLERIQFDWVDMRQNPSMFSADQYISKKWKSNQDTQQSSCKIISLLFSHIFSYKLFTIRSNVLYLAYNMGKNKTFVDLEYDDAGNERELSWPEVCWHRW